MPLVDDQKVVQLLQRVATDPGWMYTWLIDLDRESGPAEEGIEVVALILNETGQELSRKTLSLLNPEILKFTATSSKTSIQLDIRGVNGSTELISLVFNAISLTPKAFDYGRLAYRFGFNGKENDRECGTGGLVQNYGYRMYSSALGKFLSVDPLSPKYPMLTPYQFASNAPIAAIDLDGLEAVVNLNSIWFSELIKSINSNYILSNEYKQQLIVHKLNAIPNSFIGGFVTLPDGSQKSPGDWVDGQLALGTSRIGPSDVESPATVTFDPDLPYISVTGFVPDGNGKYRREEIARLNNIPLGLLNGEGVALDPTFDNIRKELNDLQSTTDAELTTIGWDWNTVSTVNTMVGIENGIVDVSLSAALKQSPLGHTFKGVSRLGVATGRIIPIGGVMVSGIVDLNTEGRITSATWTDTGVTATLMGAAWIYPPAGLVASGFGLGYGLLRATYLDNDKINAAFED